MFTMAIQRWPGVYTKIVDNSQYIEAQFSGHKGFICLFSEKGPDNYPRMTTSVSDFIKTYGAPNTKYGQGGYIATQYLQTLSNLWVMRVLPLDATYALKAVKLASEEEVQKYTVTETQDENGNVDYTFDEIIPVTVSENAVVLTEDDLDKDISTVLSTIPEGTDVIVPEGTFGYSFDTSGVKFVGARASVKPTSDEERTGGETTIEAPITPSGDVDIAGVTFKGNAVSTGFNNSSVIVVEKSVFSDLGAAAGTSAVSVVAYDPTDPNTSFEEKEEIPTKTVVTKDYYFQDIDLDPVKNLSQMDGLVNGENSTADIIFFPYGRGEYYNKLGYKLTKARKSYPNAFILDIYELPEDSSYPNMVESFVVSFDRDAVDSAGATIFIQDVLDRYSEYLRCKVSENINNYDEDTVDGFNETSSKYDNLATTDIVYLSGGSDGEMYTKAGVVDFGKVSDELALAYLGDLENPETGEGNIEIQDTEDFDITLVIDGGYPDNVKDAIITLCDKRNTCFGILDNSDSTKQGNKNAQAAIDARLNFHNYSDYRVALYEPYTKVYDNYNGRYIWVSPIYHVVDLMCKTARDYDIFWAFAGLRRGAVNTTITDYRYKLNGGFRESFVEEELNPIVRFSNGGDVLWGNWSATCSAMKSCSNF